MLIFYVFSLFAWQVVWVLGKLHPEKKSCYAQALISTAFKHIMVISGVKVTVKGQENILQGESAMYAFNHRGFFDILVGYTTGPTPMAFVSKDALAHIPLITRWMKALKCLFLDRGDIKKGMQMILDGVELLKSGHSVFIAPEGKRNHGDELLKFHKGSFKMAEKSHRPIVPVAINNTDEAFENHFPWIHKAHVIVEYCTPVYIDELEKDERKKVPERVREIISETVKKNAPEV
jgi:1-acyl-sn-glycerol-3-phosphate acyltransferase